MSSTAVLAPEPLSAGSFHGHSGGLWDAIVDKIALRDAAGSGLVELSWLDVPSNAERGMFDFVSPAS